MKYDSEYWSNRIDAATTYEAQQVIMKLRDKALRRSVINTFAPIGGVPFHLRRKQHLQQRSKGKRACGRMRGKN